jgi:streptomycin 6-kinase
MHCSYSDTFAHTITSTYGTKGTQWLAQLPQLVEQCAAEWNLTELKHYQHLTYNYVLSGMMQGTPIALKLRCDHAALLKEAVALKAFEPFRGVKLLAHNDSALLLERALPGEPLATLFPHNDAQATHIAADCLRSLHQAPIPTSPLFPTLEQLLPHFTEEPRALAPFIAHARVLRSQLLTTQTKQVFLHGDFHHGNILSSGTNWCLIDPEGIIGDPLYDLAIYIRNPITELIEASHAQTLIKNRMSDFAELLGYDTQRIYDWTYLQAVTSAYWSIEDGLDASRHVAFLKLIEEMHVHRS